MGVMGEPGVAGDTGRLTRSLMSTSSSTRSTAPLGPAQAYCPNTGLSADKVSRPHRDTIALAHVLTWKQIIDPAILGK